MQPTTEILDNVVTIAEIMSSRNLPVPDVPYLEVAKWIRVTGNVSRFDPPLRDRSCRPAVNTDPSGPGQGGESKLIVLINNNHAYRQRLIQDLRRLGSEVCPCASPQEPPPLSWSIGPMPALQASTAVLGRLTYCGSNTSTLASR